MAEGHTRTQRKGVGLAQSRSTIPLGSQPHQVAGPSPAPQVRSLQRGPLSEEHSGQLSPDPWGPP